MKGDGLDEGSDRGRQAELRGAGEEGRDRAKAASRRQARLALAGAGQAAHVLEAAGKAQVGLASQAGRPRQKPVA